MMSDYGTDWPLWLDGNLWLGSPPLSARLARDLKAWQDLFERKFDPLKGWRSHEQEEKYAELAHRLHRQIELEVGVPVLLDWWPVRRALRPRRRA